MTHIHLRIPDDSAGPDFLSGFARRRVSNAFCYRVFLIRRLKRHSISGSDCKSGSEGNAVQRRTQVGT